MGVLLPSVDKDDNPRHNYLTAAIILPSFLSLLKPVV